MNPILLIFLYLFISSCGPSIRTINVNTLKPAAVNLGGIRKIAVMGFDGQGGGVVANRIASI